MNYIIHTPSGARGKEEIVDRVSDKVDAMAREFLSTAGASFNQKVATQSLRYTCGRTLWKDCVEGWVG